VTRAVRATPLKPVVNKDWGAANGGGAARSGRAVSTEFGAGPVAPAVSRAADGRACSPGNRRSRRHSCARSFACRACGPDLPFSGEWSRRTPTCAGGLCRKCQRSLIHGARRWWRCAKFNAARNQQRPGVVCGAALPDGWQRLRW